VTIIRMLSVLVLSGTVIFQTSGFLYSADAKIKLGLEVLVSKKLDLIKGKRIGLITNPTGVNSKLQSDIDVLAKIPELKITALFGPEHGVRGDAPAGAKITFSTDTKTGLPVYSLYGATRSPTPQMLKDVDVLVFNIQDVGARYYTYIYTMAQSMKSAKDNGKKFIVLDRPNPLGGLNVEGPVLEPEFSSFIGMYSIPLVHGMTIGELALLFNEKFDINCDLEVIPMEGWTREMLWDDTGLDWINTSPNIPTSQTVLLYPCIGFIGELQQVSEGVGTTRPFEYVGAPWVDADTLADTLNAFRLPGVYFRPMHYQPFFHIFTKQQVHGVQIHITNPRTFKPVSTGLHILSVLNNLYGDKIILPMDNSSGFSKAMGNASTATGLEGNKPAKDIISSWQEGIDAFMPVRAKYLLYK